MEFNKSKVYTAVNADDLLHNWTQIPYRRKPADESPDTPRYKAIGNSMAVPVIHWIGERIKRYRGRSKMLIFPRKKITNAK